MSSRHPPPPLTCGVGQGGDPVATTPSRRRIGRRSAARSDGADRKDERTRHGKERGCVVDGRTREGEGKPWRRKNGNAKIRPPTTRVFGNGGREA